MDDFTDKSVQYEALYISKQISLGLKAGTEVKISQYQE